MSRRFIALLFLTSCRQACGLDQLEGTTGSGASGSAGGGSGSTGGAGGVSPLCADTFDGTTLVDCLVCGDGNPDSFPMQCENGTTRIEEGNLVMIPSAFTGYWNEGGSSPAFVRQNDVTGSFVAVTAVTPHDGDNPGTWPSANINLAGIVVRDADCVGAQTCNMWLKAEVGRTEEDAFALRVAGKDGALPAEDPEFNDFPLSPSTFGMHGIGVCGTFDGDFFSVAVRVRPPGGTWQTSMLVPTLTSTAVDVGIVAAADVTPDLRAVFPFFAVGAWNPASLDCAAALDAITPVGE